MKIAIVTPTIREGFWNIMAHNLSQQTDKDFIWLIVDDYKDDRKEIAEKYAKKYGLNIQYERSKKRAVKRKYGLVNANNTVVHVSDADIFIWLQDFILIPSDAVQKIRKIHSMMPNSLIACVDTYIQTQPFNTTNKEDYFDGSVELQCKTSIDRFTQQPYSCWRNTGVGGRASSNCYDFEMNFCAIPRKVITTLNGWWEFMDDGFGFDNTEFCFRALKHFGLWVAEDIMGVGIEHNSLQENDVKDRFYNYNDARFDFLSSLVDFEQLPTIRDVDIDENIVTPYNIPEFLDEGFAQHFMRTTTQFYVSYWIHKNFPEFYSNLPVKNIG